MEPKDSATYKLKRRRVTASKPGDERVSNPSPLFHVLCLTNSERFRVAPQIHQRIRSLPNKASESVVDSALYQNTEGNRNTAVGNSVLLNNTSDNDNTAVGSGTESA